MAIAITILLILLFAAQVCVTVAWVQLADRAERRRIAPAPRRHRGPLADQASLQTSAPTASQS